MKTIHLQTLATLALCVAVGGCEANKSRNPLSPTVAGPIAGVTITAPKPLEPVNNQTLTAGRGRHAADRERVDDAASARSGCRWRLPATAASRTRSTSPTRCRRGPADARRTRCRSRCRPPGHGTTGTFARSTAPTPASSRRRPASSCRTRSSSAIPTVAYPASGATIDTVTPDLTVTNGAATGSLAGPVSYRFDDRHRQQIRARWWRS